MIIPTCSSHPIKRANLCFRRRSEAASLTISVKLPFVFAICSQPTVDHSFRAPGRELSSVATRTYIHDCLQKEARKLNTKLAKQVQRLVRAIFENNQGAAVAMNGPYFRPCREIAAGYLLCQKMHRE